MYLTEYFTRMPYIDCNWEQAIIYILVFYLFHILVFYIVPLKLFYKDDAQSILSICSLFTQNYI